MVAQLLKKLGANGAVARPEAALVAPIADVRTELAMIKATIKARMKADSSFAMTGEQAAAQKGAIEAAAKESEKLREQGEQLAAQAETIAAQLAEIAALKAKYEI